MRNKWIGELEEEMYDKLIKRYTHACNGSVMDAEDIVQEAFCRALKYSDHMPEDFGRRVGWINQIAYNCFLQNRTDQRNAGTVDMDEDFLEQIPVEEGCEMADEVRELIRNHLEDVIYSYRERSKEAARVYFYKGVSLATVCELHGGLTETWYKLFEKIVSRLAEIKRQEAYFTKGKWVLVEQVSSNR